MKRPRMLLLVAALLGVSTLLLFGWRADDSEGDIACPQCNIVLITFDALRADHLGCYGYPRDTSPRLDRFARESHVFTDAWSQSGTTVPSLASLFTSRFPYADDVVGVAPRFGLVESEATIAETLKERGYSTAAVVGHKFAGSGYGFARGFDAFVDDYSWREPAETTREHAIDALYDLPSPFFLWVHFRQPHAPYEPSEESFRELYDGHDGAPTVLREGRDATFAYFSEREPSESYALGAERVRLTPSMVEQYRAMYDGNIREADRELGLLLDFLDGSGHHERTVVIVAADHGECLGEHRRIDHNRLYHGILRTPLLIRLPDREPAVRPEPAMNVDIFPTILDLLEIEPAGGARGRSLFDRDLDLVDRFQFAEYEDRKALKKGRHKLLVNRRKQGVEVELYDVVADPGEAEDLAGSLQQVRSDLLDELSRLSAIAEASRTMEELRTLGYVE